MLAAQSETISEPAARYRPRDRYGLNNPHDRFKKHHHNSPQTTQTSETSAVSGGVLASLWGGPSC